MKIVLDSGEVIELGTTATAPTIGIIDYSRRVTDDFGVTTVVERGFARRMSVQIAVPFDGADALQRRLADLRATPALWVADDRFASLSVRGFYKEFSIDLAVPPLSYCTLTVEGLTDSGGAADPGGDPAPEGLPSSLQLLQSVMVGAAQLNASNVPENDAPEWSATANYPTGVRVIKAATHRVYESVAAASAGDDPVGATGKWLDVGPTNRWAMFDQALGSITTGNGSIAVTLDVGAIDAVALLDVVAATIRVQAAGYDRIQAAGSGTTTFLDLPGSAGQITVTIAGAGVVSVGTLLVGHRVSLGITEASPTAGITDYSRKVVDDFGGVTIVQRAWAKRMTANALIRSDAVDVVADRLASVRARPSLWIGQAGLDSLTVYGFFKEFGIEIGESVSKLSLSIEGLSTAGKVEPLKVNWPNIGDPDGTKPTNNADVTGDNTSKDTDAVGGVPAGDVVGGVQQIHLTREAIDEALGFASDSLAEAGGLLAEALSTTAASLLSTQLLQEERRARYELLTHVDGEQVGSVIERVEKQSIDGDHAIALSVERVATTVETERGARAADVSRLDRADSDESTARAQAITDVKALVTTEKGDRQAAVTRLDKADADETQARAQSITDVKALITTEKGDRAADVTRLDRAIVDGDSALSQTLTSVTTTVGGHTSSIDFLLTSIDGLTAEARLTVTSGGVITGFTINGVEREFFIQADRFIVGSDRAFEVVNGQTRIRNLVIGDDNVSIANIALTQFFRRGYDSSDGGTAAGFGQTNVLSDFQIDMIGVQPAGSFQVKFIGSVQRMFSNYQLSDGQGRTTYYRYVEDGGFELFCTDTNGNTYTFAGDRYLDEQEVIAAASFNAQWRARVRRGNVNTVERDGEATYVTQSQQYQVTAFDCELKWRAF